MEQQLDLVLVNPGARAANYQSLGRELAAVEPPLWVGVLAANARKYGYHVQILDADAWEVTPQDVGRQIAAMDPRLAVVVVFGANPSASTQKMGVAGETVAAIRQSAAGVKVMLAGLHVSALPERTMREEEVDFVCQGEGPLTIRPLLDRLRAGSTDYSGVPGLWYREDGQIRSTTWAPMIQDLESELPGGAWDMLPMDKYRAHNWHCLDHIHQRSPYAVLYTSLGCPFHCHFCCINALFEKHTIRYRDMKGVMAEIDLLVQKYGVKNIKILDEMFVYKRSRVLEFCNALIPRGYDLNFWAYARVDTVDQELLDKLRQAGVRWLCYGFESASDKVRKDVRKGFSDDVMHRAIRWTQEAGINIIANYMVGLPEDDHETMQQTLDEAKSYNFEFFNLYSAMAYPGSKLFDQAMAEGWRLPDTWDGYAQLSPRTLPLPTKHLSAAEVLAFRDRAFREYFDRPEYFQMIREKFGPDAEAHIRLMLADTPQRELLGTASAG